MPPKKQKEDIKEVVEIKEEDSSSQKVLSFIARTLFGEKGIERQINIFVVSNTYYSLLEIVHTVLLFSLFNKTNSATYSVVQSAFGGYFFLVYLIPRISKKHRIFQITLILYLLGFIASGISLIVLFNAFSIFSFYCSQIKNFYEKRQQSEYLSKSMCQTVYQIYIIELIVEVFILFLRLLYLVMCFKAYIIAREKFDEQEKKKRRRDRYNQLLLKRTMYNEKRKT